MYTQDWEPISWVLLLTRCGSLIAHTRVTGTVTSTGHAWTHKELAGLTDKSLMVFAVFQETFTVFKTFIINTSLMSTFLSFGC